MAKAPLVNLGKTGIRVSKLGIGEVDFGEKDPFRLGPKEGSRFLTELLSLGVNLWDSSDDYDTHPHAVSALKIVPREKIVICYKTSSKNGKEALGTLRNFLRELQTDYIDIFLLHCVESSWVKGYAKALRELHEIRATGIVKAIGLSTHDVNIIREASQIEEVDVILTIYCRANKSIIDKYIPLEGGTIEEMADAIKLAHDNGKGTIVMKILGGRVKGPAPTLVRNYESTIRSIAQFDFVDAMFIGMSNLDEARKNVNAILSVS